MGGLMSRTHAQCPPTAGQPRPWPVFGVSCEPRSAALPAFPAYFSPERVLWLQLGPPQLLDPAWCWASEAPACSPGDVLWCGTGLHLGFCLVQPLWCPVFSPSSRDGVTLGVVQGQPGDSRQSTKALAFLDTLGDGIHGVLCRGRGLAHLWCW